ncbi:choice-of-anchor tandem repeat GloVer-containing protein [Gloeobacter kilaueensis]|uniref:3-carboxymuconate cyclase n=1 Tax=Gloeobacter kilaueensis (strain ATCC BAA-2537 / CCAP 1431/1 / ULC 316 / JS1) TaxID=1183438 RepID=U5QF70_GLOK1|nr:choice-of-anchor tandem repeat GloVer-containing protein [Gloeobacter kilaueensis]AGY57617.1 hypothetical protein GKIL_1371 [Gloeobacter kilaueensis JS1]
MSIQIDVKRGVARLGLAASVLLASGGGAGAATLSTLYTFSGTTQSSVGGAVPYGTPVQASNGNLFGTTYIGGSTASTLPLCPAGCGTVFAITPAGSLTIVKLFGGSDGAFPYTGVVGNNGSLYGTTSGGGTYRYGTVYRISSTGVFSSLYSFMGGPAGGYGGSDGAFPNAALVLADDGNFYGTTAGGGLGNLGTVFQITPAGVLTTLYSFSGPDGTNPVAGLTAGSDGRLYGTTAAGGASGRGTVFAITTGGALTTLYSFGGADGAYPKGGLAAGSDGNFYGTTVGGGVNALGTVYRISPAGSLTSLYSFAGPDGIAPLAGLVAGSDGSFYGATYAGGTVNASCTNGCGTLFRITPAGSLSTLYAFSGGSDGRNPATRLVQGGNGSFFGTTPLGGANGVGTIYKLQP